MNIVEELKARSDEKYRKFHSSLVPTIGEETVLGVRMPALRALAKELQGTPEAEDFMQHLPHTYIEENTLHGVLITMEKDLGRTLDLLEGFLPYVDNWATCDVITPKSFRKKQEELLPRVEAWMGSDRPYTVRFGIKILMGFYLDEAFRPEYLARVANIQSEEYYVNMMIAWFFATALAKQWEATIPFFQEQKMSKWVHNKGIQKAIESRRITLEQKEYLRTLRVK